MTNKIVLRISDGEDTNNILTPNGKILCTIDRDDDSFTTALKILKSLGFDVVWNDNGEAVKV